MKFLDICAHVCQHNSSAPFTPADLSQIDAKVGGHLADGRRGRDAGRRGGTRGLVFVGNFFSVMRLLRAASLLTLLLLSGFVLLMLRRERRLLHG